MYKRLLKHLIWLGLIALPVLQPAEAEAANRLHVITVSGSSDAVILESNGHYALFDAMEGFNPPDGSDPRYPARPYITVDPYYVNSDRLIAYMQEQGITHLDFIVGTHAHSDHIGGIPAVLDNVTADKLFLKRYSDDNILYEKGLYDNQYRYDNAVTAAKEHNVQLVQDITPSDASFEFGDFHIQLHNYEYEYEADGVTPLRVPDENYNSILALISGAGKRIFLGGDLEGRWGQEDYYGPIIGKVDFMKLNHHGGESSNTDSFINYLQPKAAVWTGSGTLSRRIRNCLNHNGTKLYSASLQDRKALIFDLDGGEITEISKPDYGFTNHADVWYFYDWQGNKIKNRMFWHDTKRYFADEHGRLITGWHNPGNGWFYMGTNAAALTGWQTIDGYRYYFGDNGLMRTGWQYLDGRWYYLDTNGTMKTGWIYVDNHWYYMNQSGTMVTGWAYVGEHWYYMNRSGTMVTGWVYENNRWYWLGKSGAMASKQWVYANDQWYYATASGAIVQNGWAYVNNQWYYMSGSGAMRRSTWDYINGKWYYFNGSGAMAKSQWIGSYYVDGSGAWVR
ncbi:MAG: hypothetical protein Q4P30_03685 [Eubacteriales bacterium]|nr:hypothetical protein [Eubacteriales bacterium]